MALPKWKKDRIEWARGRGLKTFLLVIQEPCGLQTRKDLERELRILRDGWEVLTGRGQDLPDERISEMSLSELRKIIGWYLSDDARSLLLASALELAVDLAKR